MKTLAIINQAAGGGRCGKLAEQAIAQLRATGFELDTATTQGPGHATELAQAAWAHGVRCFIGVGGDGTSFEIINGLFPVQGPERPTLGFLPLGTGNSFIRDFGVADRSSAIAALTRRVPRPCDVIRLDHTEGQLHYINLVSIGFSAKAAALTNRRFKGLGDLGYAVAVVASLFRHRHPSFPIRLDDGELDRRETTLLSFSNSQYTGGKMMMAPQAQVDDGQLDIIRIGPLGRRRLIQAFPRIYKGTHVDLDVVEQTTASQVILELESNTDVMVDGEVLQIQPTALTVLPGALDILV